MIKYELIIPKIGTDANPAVKRALRQSAQLVRRSATQKAPYGTGTLRRSIIEYATSNNIEIWSNLIYAPIHEFGGVIVPVRAKYLTFKVNWKRVRTKKVIMPARPYLWPALEENTNAIIQIFKRNLALDI